VQLTWTNNASGSDVMYYVYRRELPSGGWILASAGLGPTTEAFADYGVVGGNSYEYYVQAWNSCGTSASNSASVQVPTCSGSSGSSSSSSGSSGSGNYCASLPDSLTVQYTAPVNVTFTITRQSANFWSGTNGDTTMCAPESASLQLYCNGDGTFSLSAVASFRGPASTIVTADSLNPLLISYSGAESGLCGGSVTFTVSE
jgi:hypothetical protein